MEAADLGQEGRAGGAGRCCGGRGDLCLLLTKLVLQVASAKEKVLAWIGSEMRSVQQPSTGSSVR